MTSKSLLSLACLTALAAALPSDTKARRSSSDCSQYGVIDSGKYVINNDLWGEDNGSGSGCIYVDGVEDGALKWHTTWNWADNSDDVKAYPNAETTFTSTQLHDISSMKSEWQWSYSGDGLIGDVAYDMFTSSTSDGSNEYEIMVWLDRFGGDNPIATSYDSAGNAVPISHTTIAGHKFHLYQGTNDWTVFSFVADTKVTNWKGDIKTFLHHLVLHHGLPNDQYLLSVGAGTEAVIGTDAKFTTHRYKMDVET